MRTLLSNAALLLGSVVVFGLMFFGIIRAWNWVLIRLSEGQALTPP